MKSINIEKADRVLSWVVSLFALPISLIFIFKPDIYDVFTYLSLMIASWAAIFCGRGAFSPKTTNNPALDKEQAERHTQTCFWVSVILMIAAAVAIMPAIFKNNYVVLVSSLILFVGAAFGFIVVSFFQYLKDNRDSFIRPILWLYCLAILLITVLYLAANFDKLF